MIPALVVIAKSPRPGAVKTRLCPPCTPAQAAALAEAALADTLDAALATPAAEHVLALDGPTQAGLPPTLRVIPQRGDGLDERLAAAFEDVGGPALVIGMDTPQVTSALLSQALAALSAPGVDAVLGEATDGGYWAIGLQDPAPEALLGVPMSTAFTARAQRARLDGLGLAVADLPRLRDVDRFADVRAVAASHPGGRFATAVSGLPAAWASAA